MHIRIYIYIYINMYVHVQIYTYNVVSRLRKGPPRPATKSKPYSRFSIFYHFLYRLPFGWLSLLLFFLVGGGETISYLITKSKIKNTTAAAVEFIFFNFLSINTYLILNFKTRPRQRSIFWIPLVAFLKNHTPNQNPKFDRDSGRTSSF